MQQEIQEGYKQTEVGIIPEDWEVKFLFEVAKIERGKFTPRPRNNPIYYGGDIPFVQTGDVTYSNGKISKYSQTLNHKGLSVSKLFRRNTILMTIAANIGYTGMLQMDMACPDSLVAINGNETSDNSFLNYYFSLIREKIDGLSTSGAQKNLSIELLKHLQLLLPPTIQEQTAIAEALGGVDDLISNLEQLIGKKCLIKQGAMQQLLTPKEGWEVKRVFEIAEVSRGRVISHKEINQAKFGQFPVYSSQTSNYGIMGYLDTYDFEGEYITWTTDGVNAGTVYHRKGKFNCTNVCGTLKLFSDDARFVTFILNRISSKYVSKNLANPKLMNDVMKNIIIKLPNLIEQTQIATILSDIDAEIEVLEKKLSKYKMLKLGMMQNLLTGKIRLI